MKKFLKIIVILIFVLIGKVYAVDITEGSYIDDAFIKKELNGVKYYLQVQFISDDDGKIVYCLEPFVFLDTDVDYQIGSLDNYDSLTKEQLDKIKLIIYYGYNSPNRKDEIWYAITQLLIWRVVSPETPIYFTDSLNGDKSNRYDDKIDELLTDVLNYNVRPQFDEQYNVNYGDDLQLEIIDKYDYSSKDYEIEDGLISNIDHDGKIILTKRLDYNNLGDFRLYVNQSSQTLILPGAIIPISYEINVKVLKGKIRLIMEKDDDSIESRYDVCYEVYFNNEKYKEICSDVPVKYTLEPVPYGEYKIIQVKEGIGYEKIEDIFEVTVDSNDDNEVLLLSHLIWNTFYLTKYYCDIDCVLEDGASFSVKDINGNEYAQMETLSDGTSSLRLPYGNYDIEQISGRDNYKLVKPFKVSVIDSTSLLKKELFDYKEVIPPDTGVRKNNSINFAGILLYILIFLSKIRR